MEKLIFYILYFAVIYPAFSQSVNGVVYGDGGNGKEPLDGAVIRWLSVKKGTVTDSAGRFSLKPDESLTDFRIIVFYTGYYKDTVDVSGKEFIEVILKGNVTTQTIKVEGEQNSNFTANDKSKLEVITSNELKKAACCDLSGFFGRSSSVDVAVTDILLNTKELKVLGLEGAYTQVLIDNLPIMTGLETKYGITSLPGTLIDKITVAKGSNSVVQGYESISGIMNVLLKDYTTSEKFLSNIYLNSALEKQLNLNYTEEFGDWTSLLAFQTVQHSLKIDDNNDGFLDAPLTTRYMVYNKWKYGIKKTDNLNILIGIKYFNEQRISGQKNFDYDKNLGTTSVYGQTVNYNSAGFYTRINQKFNDNSSIKLLFGEGFFMQKSYYGSTKYSGNQVNIYTNFQYEKDFSDDNYLRIGASFRHEDINEDIKFFAPTAKTYAGKYEKFESVPGIFTEGTFVFKELNVSIMPGIRFDYHNQYYWITTPRLLLRFQPQQNTALRFSFGTGFRTVNLFSEYSNLLASQKNIVISGELKPEKMLNFGFDILQYFDFGYLSGNINADYYRTNFSSKVIPDYDLSPNSVTFASLSGAYSDAFQIELSANILTEFEVKLAYKRIDLYHIMNGVKMSQYFNPKDRVVAGLSYTSPDKSWLVNINLQWYGKQDLPNTDNYPVEYQRPKQSDPYTNINAQITKSISDFDFYAGVENLLNFTQKDPIISADNPQSPYFDTSFIWGPTMGRQFYFGIRYMIR
jgi:outer membrane receptor for ferrienterochelin and colicin